MKKSWKVLSVVSFSFTLFINFLAATSGINGSLTGAISDRYPTLFTPAGYVFSIWSLIYFGLICFLIYAISRKDSLAEKITPYFTLTNLLNAVWIICWHFDSLLLSVVVMLGLLIALLFIGEKLFFAKKPSLSQRWCVVYPFSLYLGWISVATIANISVYLTRISWNGFGLSPMYWTMIMTVVACLIGFMRLLYRRDVLFSFVIVWALWGIRSKLLQSTELLPQSDLLKLTTFVYYEVLVLLFGIFLYYSVTFLRRRKYL